MVKNEFLSVLEKELSQLSAAERAKTITYYSEIISDMMDAGYTEVEAINKLGNPKDIASTIVSQAKEVKAENKEIISEPKVEETKKETPVQKELKKTKKIKIWPFVLIGVIALIIFVAVSVIGMVVANNVPVEQNVRIFEVGTVNNISIDLDVDDLRIENSTDDKITFEYYTNKFNEFEIKQDKSSIVIESELDYEFFNINTKDYRSILYIPVQYNGVLDVDLSVGAIVINVDCEFERVTIENNVGAIQINKISANDINLENTMGAIEISNLVANKVVADVTTGSIKFKGMEAQDISLATTTGEIEGVFNDSMNNYSITSKTTTGDNNLPENFTSGIKLLSAKTTTGSINIKFND